MAHCFNTICSEIRSELATEAIVRHTTLDEWWDDFASALPKELQSQKEGTATWGAGMFWMLCNPPEARWYALQTAMAAAQMSHLTAVMVPERDLPIVRGSIGRITAAMHGRCVVVSHAFSERYSAMTHLAMIMQDESEARHKRAWKRRLRVAGAMWGLRAEVARTMTMVPVDVTDEDSARGIVVVKGTFYRLTCNPYRAYANLRACVLEDKSIPADTRHRLPSHVTDDVSRIFRGLPTFSTAGPYTSRLMRYYQDPSRLGDDIEDTLRSAHEDILATVELYEAEATAASVVEQSDLGTGFDESRLAAMLRPPKRVEGQLTYRQAIGEVEDQEMREAIDDWVLECDDAIVLENMLFTSADDLVTRAQEMMSMAEEQGTAAREAVN